jgi:PKD repeat protein
MSIMRGGEETMRSAQRWTFVVLVLVLTWGAGLATSGADTYPNCSWGCTANDVTAVRIRVDAPDACSTGQTITAGVYVTFNNGTKTTRYAVRLLADLYVDGHRARSFDECVADTMSSGTSDIRLTTISFPCGAAIEFRNIVLSWSASPESCSDTPDCSSRTAKCWNGGTVPVSGLPLHAAASATSPVCSGEFVHFTGSASGGSLSYAYAWSFGDGTTSTLASPNHMYPAPGTYTAALTVRDTEGREASASVAVTVNPRLTATASPNRRLPRRSGCRRYRRSTRR